MSNVWNNTIGLYKFSKQDIEQTNPKADDFQQSDNNNVDNLSVVNKWFLDEKYNASMNFDQTALDELYGAISTNKDVRLANYIRMSHQVAVGDALDEIAEEMFPRNEQGKTAILEIKKKDSITDTARKQIMNAFDEYVELFDFNNNGFEYGREFCIKGEIAWENLISTKYEDMGIVGINFLPAETYEYGFDIIKKKKEGIVVTKATGDVNTDTNSSDGGKKYGSLTVQNLSAYDKIKNKEAIFLPWEQITYVDSGSWSSDGLISYPILERARKPYNQLTLIEDAIIIYRIVRAPERLVFNVDIGGMPRSRGEQEVRKLMKRYQTKKVYNPSQGTVSNSYDPHQMLESYWFIKPEGGSGTSVETLGGGQNLGELEDLQYFQRNLYKALKVPTSRFFEPTVNIERVDSITAEEYRFSKLIMRLHTRFAKGIKTGFITHLKRKKLWESNKLKESHILVDFVPPSQFEKYEQQQMLTRKYEQYDIVAGHEEISNSIAMEEILGWTQEQIQINWDKLEHDAIRLARIEYLRNLTEETGSSDDTSNNKESDTDGEYYDEVVSDYIDNYPDIKIIESDMFNHAKCPYTDPNNKHVMIGSRVMLKNGEFAEYVGRYAIDENSFSKDSGKFKLVEEKDIVIVKFSNTKLI